MISGFCFCEALVIEKRCPFEDGGGVAIPLIEVPLYIGQRAIITFLTGSHAYGFRGPPPKKLKKYLKALNFDEMVGKRSSESHVTIITFIL